MRETIACGRGDMPTHLDGAYSEIPCYGLPLGEALPPDRMAGRQFSAEDIDDLVAFLFEHVIGVPLTAEVCAAYFNGNARAPACAAMRD